MYTNAKIRIYPVGIYLLKVNNEKIQSCKLYNKQYIIASTQITNTKIVAFIAILVFNLLNCEFLFIKEKAIETVKK